MNATPAQTQAVTTRYGAVETNSLIAPAEYHRSVGASMTLKELNGAGGRITRVRILAGQGFRDISYIHGVLPNGQTVDVKLGNLHSIGLRKWEVKRALIDWAKSQNVYGKGIGLLDDGVVSTVY